MDRPTQPAVYRLAASQTNGDCMNRMTQTLYIALGTLCVALGVLGMFVPLLPTTPFLLLAAVFYARSSTRLYHWLLTNRWCGDYIRSYRAGHGIPLTQKVLAIVLLWLTIGYTAGFVVSLWWVRLLLLGIAVGVTAHLVTIPTFRPQADRSPSLHECDSPEEAC